MTKIKKSRVSIGMTQDELGKRLGVKQPTISMWETNRAQPRAELLPKLADILGCTVDELLRKEEQ